MEGVLGVLIPFAFFAMITAIVLVPRYFKSQERMRMQELLRTAIQAGQPLPAEVVEAISSEAKKPPTPARDLRTGIIWLGIAVGIAACGVAIGFDAPDATFPMIAIAAFPGFIGLAFIVLGLLNKSAKL